MAKYSVCIELIYEVEANSPKEAEDKATKLYEKLTKGDVLAYPDSEDVCEPIELDED